MDVVINFFGQAFYFFMEYIMHFDRYIPMVMEQYGVLIYVLLFLIIFCETGLVVTPFLPGDSLLFACGALSAASAGLHVGYFAAVCLAAAILGDTSNYWIGEVFGNKLLAMKNSLIKPEHVEKAQHFYEKHGHKAIFLCRFVPIVRTFAPFVAGIGAMGYARFSLFNLIGALAWVASLSLAGYWFGNMPWIKQNLSVVIVGIIVVSLVPVAVGYLKHRQAA